jgi:hypothetical protein
MTIERPVPPIRVLSKETRDEAARLSVMNVLWNVLKAFKTKTDPASWSRHGWNDTEEFLECLESGRSHPVLDRWLQLRKNAGNRPVASSREQACRRFAVLACEALKRRCVGKDQARRMVAKELAHAKAFASAPSSEAIRNRQRSQPPLTTEDEKVIANALAQASGRSDSDLVKYFVGLIQLAHDPAPLQRFKRVP